MPLGHISFRLGLMPGALFHSCRPSFRHTGVMFPDFAFLTRLGDLWDPLDNSLWIKLLQQGPLIALLVTGEVEDCSMVDRIMLGYHNISYIINASIYLVKGGRLGLMPGVLFHSCHPSFHYTSVMFLDFAFLTRLGDLWDPLDSSLWIELLQQGPTLILPFAYLSLFPLGF